jgi:hypothetical protein
MSGINQSKVTVTLRNPLDFSDTLDYYITVADNPLAVDWQSALKDILTQNHLLEKNFCFLGFPHTARTIDYLMSELNQSIDVINDFFDDYTISEIYSVDTIRNGLDPNQNLMNHLHNHFEILQGTVENLSTYYCRADYATKYAIRQLNLICHELESLMLSLRKLERQPAWVRSSQITTFINCKRLELTNEHRQLFSINGYDRVFGGVYMHWTQIGKTLFEVFRDEHAPNNLNPTDTKLSLGYLPLGQVDLLASFNTEDPIEIRELLGKYLDIYSIQIDDVEGVFDYCWTDADYKQQQINKMRAGYDFSSRG